MKKALSIVLLFCFCFNVDVSAQKKQKNTWTKEQNSKSDYQYKTHFYLALKEKSLENFDKALKHFLKCIKLNPNEAAAFYESAIIYSNNQEYKLSLEYSKIASELDDKNKWYLEFYAQNLYNNREFYKAIKVYKLLIKQHSENQDYYLQLADTYIFYGKLKEAIKVYDNLEGKKGASRFISITKHRMYLDLNDIKSAIKEIENIISEFPNDKETYVLLSDCYILNNDFDKAFEVLKKIVEIDPNDISVHLSLSDFYYKKGDNKKYFEELNISFSSDKLDVQSKIQKIIPLLEKEENLDSSGRTQLISLIKTLVSVHPENAIPHYIYADLLRSNNELDLALIHYKLVVKYDENQQEAWRELLFLELTNGNFKEVVNQSNKTLDLFPTNPLFYYLNGLAYYNQDKWIESILSLESGIVFVYNNNQLTSEMYSLIGGAHNELEEFLESDKAYEKALEYFPENVQVLNNYAYYLSLRGENLEKAKVMSSKTIKKFPEESNYYDTYAWILYKMKDYKDAKLWMQKAIDLGESKTFYNHMADILLELGESEESNFYREKAKQFKVELENE